MGVNQRLQGDPSGADSERGDSPGQRWVVGGDRTCDHVTGDAVLLGIGGLYDYERCRRCDAIVVSGLLE